jgi:GTP cyclohydrolase I
MHPTVTAIGRPPLSKVPVEILVQGKQQRLVNPDTLSDEWLAKQLLIRCIQDWDSEDDHSKNTPARLVATLRELGNRKLEAFTFTTFVSTSDEMIILSNIPFYTLCAHHVVPFHGRAHIGYVPHGKIAGLSKLGRTVKYVSRGLWVQEDLTAAIHDFLHEKLAPRGIAVVLQAEHMCMSMRGVQMPGVVTTTNRMSGVFGDHTRTAKAEFMEMIKSG